MEDFMDMDGEEDITGEDITGEDNMDGEEDTITGDNIKIWVQHKKARDHNGANSLGICEVGMTKIDKPLKFPN